MNSGGNAFGFSRKVGISNGLTKREWLIGQIANGYAADPDNKGDERAAKWCIKFTDEIIKQLNEGKKDGTT